MRLHSSRETVKGGQPTILAIIEAFVMTGLWLLTGYAAWRNGITVWKIVFSSLLVGPALLLRTDWSTRLGLNYYGRILELVQRVGRWSDIPSSSKLGREFRVGVAFAFFLLVIPVLLMFARFASVVDDMVRN
jgi:DMSO reductase anchor subunit